MVVFRYCGIYDIINGGFDNSRLQKVVLEKGLFVQFYFVHCLTFMQQTEKIRLISIAFPKDCTIGMPHLREQT